jgi:parallel beta-helix repeat protein
MRQRLWARLTHAKVAATLVSLAVLLTSVVVALVALGESRATAAQQVNCGDTITTDATLHHNLVNCPNNGIVIGADNVTLDLNYHTIDGDGIPNAGCNPQNETCDVGVDIEGHDGDTVVNGSVRQFEDGVVVETTRHTRLLGVSSSANQFSAIVLFQSVRSVVRNSSGNGSSASVGQGMFLTFSHRVRIVHNSFRNNVETGIGVFESTHNLIKGNVTSHNKGFAGINLDGDRNRVLRNRSVRAGAVGILVLGNHNLIARNRASHLRQPGRGEGVAIELEGGDRNVIARNSLRDTEGDAIRMGFGRAEGNVVRLNRIRGAGEDGVHVDAKAGHTLLVRNHARHSRDDGIDVENRRTKLSRNRALRNGDLGIAAVRGVIDAGGNKARGNGDPRQCTHIVCR